MNENTFRTVILDKTSICLEGVGGGVGWRGGDDQERERGVALPRLFD